MNIQNNNNPFSAENVVKSSVLGGLAAATIERAILPAEAKAALRNTRFGEDAFLKRSAKCFAKTVKNTGKNLDFATVMENAKNMYPEMLKTRKAANKMFAKTFAGVAIAVAGAKLLSSMIIKARASKQQ